MNRFFRFFFSYKEINENSLTPFSELTPSVLFPNLSFCICYEIVYFDTYVIDKKSDQLCDKLLFIFNGPIWVGWWKFVSMWAVITKTYVCVLWKKRHVFLCKPLEFRKSSALCSCSCQRSNAYTAWGGRDYGRLFILRMDMLHKQFCASWLLKSINYYFWAWWGLSRSRLPYGSFFCFHYVSEHLSK